MPQFPFDPYDKSDKEKAQHIYECLKDPAPPQEWMKAAAEEIERVPECPPGYRLTCGDTPPLTRPEIIQQIIAKHVPRSSGVERLTLDTDERVYFYEREFYVLSNFSSFRMYWMGLDFDTSEALYHWEKFPDQPTIQRMIRGARSAHEAFKIAERHKASRRPDWDGVKVSIMLDILRSKANQHEYVRRKLLETGDRLLVENSWRDNFWGWGEDRQGQNMLGRLWMQVRSELRSALAALEEG